PLGTVRDGGALELARLEEAAQEHSQPVLDRRQRVFVPALDRNQIRPGALCPVLPRVVRQEGDLARSITEPEHVVEKEVVQLVWTDRLLAVLELGLFTPCRGNQLRG